MWLKRPKKPPPTCICGLVVGSSSSERSAHSILAGAGITRPRLGTSVDVIRWNPDWVALAAADNTVRATYGNYWALSPPLAVEKHDGIAC